MKGLKYTALLLVFGWFASAGQNIETITTIPKPGISGGLQVTSQFYNVDGIEARRSPFSYVVAGNTRFKWGLINVPLSFSFRDQNLSYGASFNKFGMSPYYKWAKLHLGHRSMRFGKYSLTGKNFFGIGTELTPGNLRFSAFRGTIRNHLALRDTLIYGANLVPTYKRRATGVKLGYGSTRNFIDFTYLKIKDDADELFEGDREAVGQLDPSENLVLGTSWRFHVIRSLSLSGNLNVSAFTENTLLKPLKAQEGVAKAFQGFTTVNASTQASFAGDLGINLNLSGFQIGGLYRRIEPNYRSLGILFIQADLESYTLTTTFSLFQRKLTISGQGGVERNNLRNLDYLGRKRVIAGVNAQIMPAPGITAGLNYTNYQYESVDGLVEINDTLRYIAVNKSLGGNAAYTTRNESFNYGGFLYVNRMVVEDLSPLSQIGADITTLTTNLGLSMEWVPLDLTVKPGIIFNKFQLPNDEQKSYGISARVNKLWMNKTLSTGSNFRFTYNDRNDKRDGRVFSANLSTTYKVTLQHLLKFNIGYINRSSIVRNSFSETRINLGYGLRF